MIYCPYIMADENIPRKLLEDASNPQNRQQKSKRPYFQNNLPNMDVIFFVHRYPKHLT